MILRSTTQVLAGITYLEFRVPNRKLLIQIMFANSSNSFDICGNLIATTAA